MRTDRLLLRRWRPDDREGFAALNADPEVMRHLPTVLERKESDALADRIETHFDEHGFGMWAVELPGRAAFIGCVGLMRPAFQAPFMPCVEVAWRLLPDFWGHGFATEAARRCLQHGFESLGLPEILSFTVPENVRSRAVMERIGMQLRGEFDHPSLPPGHRLRRHVLYGLENPAQKGRSSSE